MTGDPQAADAPKAQSPRRAEAPLSWLMLLQYAVSVGVVGAAGGLALLPGVDGIVAAAVVPFAVIYALVVAFPAALVFRARGWRGPLRASLAGGLIGIFPPSILALVLGDLASAAQYAGMGFLGGLAAWTLVELQKAPARFFGPRWGMVLGLVVTSTLVVLAGWGASKTFRHMSGADDPSCHNLSRYAARSHPVVLTAKLKMNPQDWPRLHATLKAAGAADGWSVRNYDHRPESFGASLCQEVGTLLSLSQWTWTDPPHTEVSIRVVAPQGGDRWRPAVDRLLNRLEAEWPGALKIEPPTPASTAALSARSRSTAPGNRP